jgi:hypothetical protein
MSFQVTMRRRAVDLKLYPFSGAGFKLEMLKFTKNSLLTIFVAGFTIRPRFSSDNPGASRSEHASGNAGRAKLSPS